VVFGIAAIIVALRIADGLGARHARPHPEDIPSVAPPIPPFSSGKAATALDWADPEEKVK